MSKYAIILLLLLGFMTSCKSKSTSESANAQNTEKANSLNQMGQNANFRDIDPRFFTESKGLSTFKGNSIMTDSLTALIYAYTNQMNLPLPKKFYFNALSFIYQTCKDYAFADTETLRANFQETFPNKDACAQMMDKKLVFRKFGDNYLLYIVYPDFNISYNLGYSYVIFDKNGDIICDYMEYGGKYCCDADNRTIDILDWNKDGVDEIVVNFRDSRGFYTALHEDVYQFDPNKKELKNIFKFDKMFSGSEDPKGIHAEEANYQEVFFHDTAYYKIMSPDLIKAHFEYTRSFVAKNGQKTIKNKEAYDYDIKKNKGGIYENKNYTPEFWNARKKVNIWYNPTWEIVSTRENNCR